MNNIYVLLWYAIAKVIYKNQIEGTSGGVMVSKLDK